MSGELAYVDSSAIVKLIKEEEETEAISAALTEWPDLVSADLLDVEVTRVGRGLGLEREAEGDRRSQLDSDERFDPAPCGADRTG